MSKTKIPLQNMTSHEDIEDEQEKNVINIPAPPDGGYGWVIVVASFVCNMVVDGICYTFGIFLFEIIQYYNASKGKTAWVGSILTGTYLIIGPLVSALCNKFGCRAVCVAGSIISTVAFALSIFSPTVNWLMFTYGFLGGFGFGLIYLPAVVCVGYYFESKRSLATGIAVCGSGAGTFAFAPLATVLLDRYGWKGANLILAGIIFNCAIFGALMRPLEYTKKDSESHTKLLTTSISSGTATSFKDVRKRNDFTHHEKETDGESLQFASKSSLASKKSTSRTNRTIQPMARKDVFYSGSIEHLAEYQSQKSLASYRQSVLSIPRAEHDNISGNKCLPNMDQICDLSLLKNVVFLLIGISNFFAMAGLYVPFTYLVDCAKSKGIDGNSASFLISIMGITNTIARIICGYITDLPQVDALFVNNICLVIGTLSIAAIPFCNAYSAYVGVAIFFAIAVAGFISLSSIILVDLVGLDKLTNAFGLLTFYRGAAALIGTPLAGTLYDMTQSYELPFFVAASLFGLAAITSFTAPLLKRTSHKKIETNDVLTPINEENEV
ncbi:monocarboxylate transporter 12 [Anoplophora glabripennis]|nr:monocarboxylate transporter 12 [Anoplophora glabripennis]